MHGEQTPSKVLQLCRQELTAMTAAHKSTSCHGRAFASVLSSADQGNNGLLDGFGHPALVASGRDQAGELDR